MKDLSLEELYDMKRRMEDNLENFFGGETKYRGDRGYQDKLEDLEEVEDEIERRESSNENNMNNLMNFDQFSLNEKNK